MNPRKIQIIYAILLAVALATMGLLWKFNTAPKEIPVRDYPQIKQEGILRIITEYDNIGYYVSGDTIEGFQYELSKAIASLSGLEVETHLDMSLTNSFKELNENKCDVIARNIPITSEMKEEYLFTDPIILNKQVLVQRTEEANNGIKPIRNQLDLAGKTLYIPQDSPSKLRLKNLEHEIGDTLYIREDPLYSAEQLIIMVAKGDIDYAVCDKRIAEASRGQLPEIDIDTDISFTQLQSWAVRKSSPELLDSLNSWFGQIRENGMYDRIYERYYESEN